MHGGVRGNHSRDRLGKLAMVCGAGGQQMVYPRHCRGSGHRCVGCDELAVSESQRGQAPGISSDEEGVARGEMSDLNSPEQLAAKKTLSQKLTVMAKTKAELFDPGSSQ